MLKGCVPRAMREIAVNLEQRYAVLMGVIDRQPEKGCAASIISVLDCIAIFVKSMTCQERCGDHSITIPNG